VLSLHVDFYENSNYRGKHYWCDNLENYSHCYFTGSANDHASSMRIKYGSCITAHDHAPPAGLNVTIAYPNRQVSDFMGTGLNDKISSIKKCPISTKSYSCPAGTFVRSFSRSADQYGFQAKCFLPSNRTHSVSTISMGPSSGMQIIRDCSYGAVRGVTTVSDSNLEATRITGADCTATSCGANAAVCGFSGLVESTTNLIKYTTGNRLTVRCCDVGDPTKLCDPEDFFEPILICDNLEALAPTTCTYSETVGIGNSTSSGEGGSTERTFYSEMGFNFGASGFGLSANFHAKLGESNTTGFNWNTASSQTWNQQVSTTVEMTVPPCMKSELLQVVGECSFFSVHARVYKRVDTTCNGTVVESMVTDPNSMELTEMAIAANGEEV